MCPPQDKVMDHFTSSKDFESALDAAEGNATSGQDVGFVAGLQERYNQYGTGMYLSAAQYSRLMRLAGEDE